MSRRESVNLHKYSRFERRQEYDSSDSEYEDSESEIDCGENRRPPRLPPRKSSNAYPACGLPARGRIRYNPNGRSLSALREINDVSSSFETTGDTRTSQDTSDMRDEESLSDLYTPIVRNRPLLPRSPPAHFTGLSMIEELSPVMPDPLDDDLPMVPTLKLQRDWRPQTSTATNFQHILPKTNPHHGPKVSSSTPRTSSRRRLANYNQLLFEGLERPSSYYNETDDLDFDFNPSSSSSVPSSFFKPENFSLPSAYAKNKGINGIVYLTMTLCGRSLSVNVHKAVYFYDPIQVRLNTYVRVELKHRTRESRKRHSSQQSSRRHCSDMTRQPQTHRTRLMPATNKPHFGDAFTFEIDDRENSRDFLSVAVHAVSAENNKKKMLGCMAFPMKRILKKAREANGFSFDEVLPSTSHHALVNDGGFFMLKPTMGDTRNLPQHKVNVRTYYDDQVFSGTMSSSSLSTATMMLGDRRNSMLREEWRASSSHSSTPGYASAEWHGHQLPALPDSYTTASSSTNNSDYGRAAHRVTLPSITTSDATSEGDMPVAVSPLSPVNYGYLYPDASAAPEASTVQARDRPTRQSTGQTSVRRAASFTFSPKNSIEKNNRRLDQFEVPEQRKEKKFFGPISKTLSYIRNKMDTALSTSSLYPTKDDVRLWEKSFDSLLNNKYGCSLFRQFLKKEFSEENVDFWLETEEYKKMKEGKKETLKKAQEIYKEYVAEQSPKEVNLDSDTRAATKAALENGCKLDTFSLAQSRIEQLMNKDSYRRFLKDRLFLDLVEGFDHEQENGAKKDKEEK